MSAEGPKPYPVVYDAENGLQYSYQTGYEPVAIPPSTDVTVEDINAEASTDGQVIASNGDGTASWTDVPAPTITVEDINSEASTDGQVIASNGDGTASWVDPATTGTIYASYTPTIMGATASAVSFKTATTGSTVTVNGYYIAGSPDSNPISFTLPAPINTAHLPTGVAILGTLSGAADARPVELFYDGSSSTLVFVWGANSAGSAVPTKALGGLLDDGDGVSIVFTYPI